VISSAAFGLLHERWFAATLCGGLYALAAWRTGRLRDAVVAHAVTNALIAAVVLASGRWGLWS
jgi:membrane protease YdiL (CAAX protease family)